MNIPTDLFHWLMAFLPILALLILMLGLHLRATLAAPAGLLAALLTALLVFRADPSLVVVQSVKGLWSALTVIIVIWPALLLYEVASQAQAFSAFRAGIRRLLPNELLQVLAIGLGFVGFLIGITGFGVPVAVGGSLLVGIGVNPLYAVVISLIGEAWGSTFGTLAVAWDALRLATGLDSDPALLLRTALWAGVFIWIWNFMIGAVICWLYGRAEGLKKGLPAILVISLIQGGGQLLTAQFNQTIACFLPTCIALAAIFLLGRTPLYRDSWRKEDSPIMDRSLPPAEAEEPPRMSLTQAFLPYFVLTALTLIVLLIPPVKAFLGQWSFGPPLPETVTGYGYIDPASAAYSPIAPLTHASLFLLLSSCFALVYYKGHGWIESGSVGGIFLRSLKKMVPSGLAVAGFLVMSRIMSGSGQTAVLAAGMAAVLGRTYALLSPMVGLLGAFMTSSNMASNILFSEFQFTTAHLLGLDVAKVLGAQTAGGAIGAATCPGNVVLGTTTANILGQEGDVLKKTLPVSMAAAVMIGLILLFIV